MRGKNTCFKKHTGIASSVKFLINLLLLLGGYDYKYKDVILHTVRNVSGFFEICIFLPRFYGCWDVTS